MGDEYYRELLLKLKGALYDEWVHRDIEDSCNCEYIIDKKLESGEITMEEAESDTPQCQYCVVMDVFCCSDECCGCGNHECCPQQQKTTEELSLIHI